jgi:hypothetical protein
MGLIFIFALIKDVTFDKLFLLMAGISKDFLHVPIEQFTYQ